MAQESKRGVKRWFTVVGYWTDSENDPEFAGDPDGYQRYAGWTTAATPKEAEANIRARQPSVIVAGVLLGRRFVER